MFIYTGISVPQASQPNDIPSTTTLSEKVLKPKSNPTDNIGPYVTLYITCIVVVKQEQKKSENSKRLLCMARNLNEVRVRQNYSTPKTPNTVSDEVKEILADLQDSLKHKNNGKKPNNNVSEIGGSNEVFDPPNKKVYDIPCSSMNSSGHKLLKLVSTTHLIIRKDPEPSITGKLIVLNCDVLTTRVFLCGMRCRAGLMIF